MNVRTPHVDRDMATLTSTWEHPRLMSLPVWNIKTNTHVRMLQGQKQVKVHLLRHVTSSSQKDQGAEPVLLFQQENIFNIYGRCHGNRIRCRTTEFTPLLLVLLSGASWSVATCTSTRTRVWQEVMSQMPRNTPGSITPGHSYQYNITLKTLLLLLWRAQEVTMKYSCLNMFYVLK